MEVLLRRPDVDWVLGDVTWGAKAGFDRARRGLRLALYTAGYTAGTRGPTPRVRSRTGGGQRGSQTRDVPSTAGVETEAHFGECPGGCGRLAGGAGARVALDAALEAVRRWSLAGTGRGVSPSWVGWWRAGDDAGSVPFGLVDPGGVSGIHEAALVREALVEVQGPGQARPTTEEGRLAQTAD